MIDIFSGDPRVINVIDNIVPNQKTESEESKTKADLLIKTDWAIYQQILWSLITLTVQHSKGSFGSIELLIRLRSN